MAKETGVKSIAPDFDAPMKLVDDVAEQPDPLYRALAVVAEGKEPLAWARTQIRNYVASLSDEERVAWKEKAVPMGRRLMAIAEGLAQELTVIAAGQ